MFLQRSWHYATSRGRASLDREFPGLAVDAAGATELPLLLKDFEMPVSALDTTRIRVDVVLEAASKMD